MIHNSFLCSNIDRVFIDNCAFVNAILLNNLKHLVDNELHYLMQGRMEERVVHRIYTVMPSPLRVFFYLKS